MKIIYTLLTSFLLLTSTVYQNKVVNIPYKVANGYFVKNTFKGTLNNNKITSKEAFDNIFGMATVMGENGKPTPIDFKKNYVIALINPINNFSAKIIPIQLIRKNKTTLQFTYKIEEQESKTYATQASLIIIVNKKYSGKVKLEGYAVK